MMSEASFASLGPTLLARKGGAKPAMRPQLTPLPEDVSSLAALAEEQLEDLGWNVHDVVAEGAYSQFELDFHHRCHNQPELLLLVIE